jgi:hypothetical protein
METKQIKKLLINKVDSYSTKKDKTPLINKWGKPYWMIGLTTGELGAEKLWGFSDYDCKDWAGQVKELEIWQEEYNGKIGWKFAIPVFKITKEMWDKVISNIENLRKFLVLPKTETPPDIEYPETDESEIPFN